MIRVRCKTCGDTGYTASPKYIICKYGGIFLVLPEKKENDNKEC